MITVDIKSLNNLESELWRIIYTANTIAVSPSVLQKFPLFREVKAFENYTYLPYMDAFASHEFWQKIKISEFDALISESKFMQFSKYFTVKDKNFITNSLLPLSTQVALESKLQKYIQMTYGYLESRFSIPRNIFSKVTLMLTNFGTDGSYYFSTDGSISLIYRVDAPVSTIAKMIFQIYLRQLLYPQGISNEETFAVSGGWDKVLSIADFLLNFGVHELKLDDELSPRPQKNDKDLNDSQMYLDSLGVVLKPVLNLIGGRIHYKEELCYQFSPQEELVMQLLIVRRNLFVSSHEIGKKIWGNDFDSKYSFTYIPKLLSTIKTKLKKLNDDSIQLVSRRKLGYMLKL